VLVVPSLVYKWRINSFSDRNPVCIHNKSRDNML
jgi:hypothetical protein